MRWRRRPAARRDSRRGRHPRPSSAGRPGEASRSRARLPGLGDDLQLLVARALRPVVRVVEDVVARADPEGVAAVLIGLGDPTDLSVEESRGGPGWDRAADLHERHRDPRPRRELLPPATSVVTRPRITQPRSRVRSRPVSGTPSRTATRQARRGPFVVDNGDQVGLLRRQIHRVGPVGGGLDPSAAGGQPEGDSATLGLDQDARARASRRGTSPCPRPRSSEGRGRSARPRGGPGPGSATPGRTYELETRKKATGSRISAGSQSNVATPSASVRALMGKPWRSNDASLRCLPDHRGHQLDARHGTARRVDRADADGAHAVEHEPGGARRPRPGVQRAARVVLEVVEADTGLAADDPLHVRLGRDAEHGDPPFIRPAPRPPGRGGRRRRPPPPGPPRPGRPRP